jgi:hypothetical protein
MVIAFDEAARSEGTFAGHRRAVPCRDGDSAALPQAGLVHS